MRAALVGCLLLACGGRATERDAPVPRAAAGEASSGGDESGSNGDSAPGGGSMPSGDAPNTPDPVPQAGETNASGGGLGEGGAAQVQPLIDPGTRICQDYRDCLGLDCLSKSGKQPSVCSVACSDAAPCADNERCVSGSGLTPACLVRCDVGTECSYPFDCYDPYGDGAWVCVPAPWTDKW